jgi:hypothetical protein
MDDLVRFLGVAEVMGAMWILLGQSCESCHAESKEEFEPSAHRLGGLDCASCHGSDGIDEKRIEAGRSPHLRLATFVGRPKDVIDFCRRCHGEVAQEFRAGAHASPASGKPLTCLTCHHHHSTEPARFKQIRGRCASCHRNTPMMEQVRGIESAMAVASEAAGRLRERLRTAEPLGRTPGVDLSGAEAIAAEAESLRSALRTGQHRVSAAAAEKTSARIVELDRRGEDAIRERRDELAARPWLLLTFLLLLGATGLLAILRIKKASER